MNKIAPAFIAAKKAFAPLLKDKTNPAFRSKYADLGACIDSVEDALLANDIAVYHETSEDATGITVECVLLHSSGETIRGGKLHVPAAKQDPQGYGSALTYARRYSLTAVCGIAPEDDDGNAGSQRGQPASNQRYAHTKGNERGATTAERVANEIIEAIRGDLTLTVVEKYSAACEDGDLADQVWARLSATDRSYVTTALNASSSRKAA